MMNKKAEERYLSPIMFFVWGLISISMITGVLIYYSAKADVRAEEEAEFLALKIIDCLVDNGYLNENVKEGFDIFKECKLSEKVITSEYFYFHVSFSDISDPVNPILNNPIKEIEKGYKDLKTQCEIKEDSDSKAKYFANCFTTSVYTSNKSDSSQKFLIEFIAGSNQLGKEL